MKDIFKKEFRSKLENKNDKIWQYVENGKLQIEKVIEIYSNYVYELIRKGKLKAFKLKSIRILKSALEDFLKQNEGNDLSDIDNIRRLSEYEDNER